jgi:hypothetical protein
MGGGLTMLAIVFFGLTLPLIVEGAPLEMKKLMALAGFWAMGIVLTILPLLWKLEVGQDYVKTYFLGFCVMNVRSSDVQVLVYGNLFVGGLGGKGLTFRALTRGRSKAYSIGEAFYGKEAIAHVRRVLERKG